jgi:plasmid stabilization system protein ParE
MARALIFSERALADIDRLKAFIAFDSANEAERAIIRIVAALDVLTLFPLSGIPVRGDIRRFVITHGRSAYIVRYRVTRDAIVVTRLWHALEKRSK